MPDDHHPFSRDGSGGVLPIERSPAGLGEASMVIGRPAVDCGCGSPSEENQQL